jgi:uncharacterized protein (TIGR02466 family)
VPLHAQATDSISLVYPTPVLVQTVPDAIDANERLRNLILRKEREGESAGRSNIHGWHSSTDFFEWPDPEIAIMRRLVGQAIATVLKFVTGKDEVDGEVQATGWANVLRSGSYNKPHNHPNSMWSGVYYVDAGTQTENSLDSGRIEFIDPRAAVNMTSVPGDPFAGKFTVQPETGMLIVFPSWLIHYVNPYEGEGARISIAFNVNLRSAFV